MLPDQEGEKIMGKFGKCIKYDEIITEEGLYNAMHNKFVLVRYDDIIIEEGNYYAMHNDFVSIILMEKQSNWQRTY